MSIHERIRAGRIAPWVGEGVAGALASASVVRDELGGLAADDPRRADLEAQEQAWRDLADTWAVDEEHDDSDDDDPVVV